MYRKGKIKINAKIKTGEANESFVKNLFIMFG